MVGRDFAVIYEELSGCFDFPAQLIPFAWFEELTFYKYNDKSTQYVSCNRDLLVKLTSFGSVPSNGPFMIHILHSQLFRCSVALPSASTLRNARGLMVMTINGR